MQKLRCYDMGLAQLERVQELEDTEIVRIWRVLWDDCSDRYVVLLVCEDRWDTWLRLMCSA